jgi:hypothetical protein
VASGALLGIFLDPEDGSDMFFGNVTVDGLHGVISQKIELIK